MGRISNNLREQVRKRANERCEYCHIPEGFTHFSHQVDHIIPPRHGGVDEIQNLAWACFYCNNNKGTDIATYDLNSRQPVFLYNPYFDEWSEHFTINENGYIIANSSKASGTIRLLKMNNYKRVEIRKLLLNSGRWK